MRFLLPAVSLWWREIVGFGRQRSRVVGALGPPAIFWLLLGSGVGPSFHLPAGQGEMGYLEYFFPGTVLLIVLFTSIFSTISIIEDRREGFLQSVLVAPVPRSALVFGKILGGMTLGLLQGILFLLLSPLAGLPLAALPAVALSLTFVSFALTGLGYVIAWKLDSTQGFHAIMNLFLIPMWLLSGAVFPPSGSAGWLRAVIAINPLTYGLAAVRRSFYSTPAQDLPSYGLAVGVTLAFGLVTFVTALAMTRQR